MMKSQRKLWLGLLVMALLSPLGLLLPRYFNAGEAWGEWGPERLATLLGYLPEGLRRLTGMWKAPLPDYSLGEGGSSSFFLVMSYLFSGILGMLTVALVTYLIMVPMSGITAIKKQCSALMTTIVSKLLRSPGKSE